LVDVDLRLIQFVLSLEVESGKKRGAKVKRLLSARGYL
jgi:hypothetical protein